MWGPRLKYHLRGPREGHPIVVFVSGSLRGWSLGRFLLFHRLDLVCLVTKLPLVGVTRRGCADTCTGLWSVADRQGYKAFWQTSSHPIALFRFAWPWTTFLKGGGCESPGKGYPLDLLTVRISGGLNPFIENSVLIRRAYPMSQWSWQLCMFSFRVAMSGGDGTGSSTRVPTARHAWAPVVTSCLVWH
jgi:hypothetical protein